MVSSVFWKLAGPFVATVVAVGAWTSAARAAEPIYVTIDIAKVARLPTNAATLVIGNPAIADVTMVKASASMVITGKSYGETNLIALDKNGELVAESAIRVRQNNATILVQRGSSHMSYSCSPDCQPSPQLGDDPDTFSTMVSQAKDRAASATGAAQAQMGGR